MTSLWRLARQHGLAVVEDAAHAVGASRTGQRVGGGQSDAVVFSFYATKNMTTGEGGMVTTPSEELHDRLRVLSLHGMSKQAWNRYSAKGSWAYDVVSCGFKYNMTDIAAAIGSEQLARLDAMTRRRREIVAAYASAFAGVPELETPPAGDPGHCWHLFVLRLNLEMLSIDRAEFFDEMKARGISCSVHFIPIPLHSHYRNSIEMRDPCNRALSEYPRMISLPLYPRMSDEQVNRVIETVRDIATSHSRRSRTLVAGAEAND
jgi:dTDP-4-amino-4,6-dideoxygalactose transaminase